MSSFPLHQPKTSQPALVCASRVAGFRTGKRGHPRYLSGAIACGRACGAIGVAPDRLLASDVSVTSCANGVCCRGTGQTERQQKGPLNGSRPPAAMPGEDDAIFLKGLSRPAHFPDSRFGDYCRFCLCRRREREPRPPVSEEGAA